MSANSEPEHHPRLQGVASAILMGRIRNHHGYVPEQTKPWSRQPAAPWLARYKAISVIPKIIGTKEQRKLLRWSLNLKAPKEEQQENVECPLMKIWAVGMRGVAMSSPGSVVSGFTHDAIRQVLETRKVLPRRSAVRSRRLGIGRNIPTLMF